MPPAPLTNMHAICCTYVPASKLITRFIDSLFAKLGTYSRGEGRRGVEGLVPEPVAIGYIITPVDMRVQKRTQPFEYTCRENRGSRCDSAKRLRSRYHTVQENTHTCVLIYTHICICVFEHGIR